MAVIHLFYWYFIYFIGISFIPKTLAVREIVLALLHLLHVEGRNLSFGIYSGSNLVLLILRLGSILALYVLLGREYYVIFVSSVFSGRLLDVVIIEDVPVHIDDVALVELVDELGNFRCSSAHLAEE